MHRIYTVEQYLEKVQQLRAIVPGASLGTDIIVGFPTETEEEFEQTYALFKEIRYSVAFIFAYSARKGTPAFRWRDDIPEEIKDNRLQRLLALYNEISAEERASMLNERVEVLVERRNRDEKHLKGRTRCWKNVIFTGDDSLIGTLQHVTIKSFSHQTFFGNL
jgi:tRNA-2-methylthio-N6-dimethylallyladenosine synthase